MVGDGSGDEFESSGNGFAGGVTGMFGSGSRGAGTLGCGSRGAGAIRGDKGAS